MGQNPFGFDGSSVETVRNAGERVKRVYILILEVRNICAIDDRRKGKLTDL